MRNHLLTLGIVLTALFAGPIAAAAANSPAQIVNCGSTWCFSPNPIRITTGSTVTWTNNTQPSHTATSDTMAWDTGVIANGRTSVAITFNSAGTFAYHCSIHPTMHGTIIVSAASTTTATAAPTVRPTSTARTHSLATTGGVTPALPIGAGLAFVGLAFLAAGVLRRRQPQA